MQIAREIGIGKFQIGGYQPLFLIAGPCVIESEGHALQTAERLAEITSRAGVPFIFKASYDKANRSSEQSYRGPGLAEGLRILKKIKDRFGLPILTDIHEASQAATVAEVADVLQIPAFLSRQTDLLVAAGRTGRVVNLKMDARSPPLQKPQGWGTRHTIANHRDSPRCKSWRSRLR